MSSTPVVNLHTAGNSDTVHWAHIFFLLSPIMIPPSNCFAFFPSRSFLQTFCFHFRETFMQFVGVPYSFLKWPPGFCDKLFSVFLCLIPPAHLFLGARFCIAPFFVLIMILFVLLILGQDKVGLSVFVKARKSDLLHACPKGQILFSNSQIMLTDFSPLLA